MADRNKNINLLRRKSSRKKKVPQKVSADKSLDVKKFKEKIFEELINPNGK